MARSPLRTRGPRAGRLRVAVVMTASLVIGVGVPLAAAAAVPDPRVGLAPGFIPWTSAASNLELLDNDPQAGAFNPSINSDLAFSGTNAIVGNFTGFQVYDLSNPVDPVLRSAFVCPGGQGDPSVYGNLLFISVEQTSARIDCGTQGAPGAVNAERFRGVRIFDISDIDNPVQLPGVQLCRGSHTHTVVTDPDDPDNIYIYNSGTSSIRPPEELAGCDPTTQLTTEPVTSGDPTYWRIDVIKVPLAAPETASVVSQPRLFIDPATGAYNGLQNTLPGTALHPSGTVYSPTPNTNTCHDVTAFPEIGLLAGACQGNGILVDITDPVNPVRLDAVSDPNFAYWHSATFSNDGSKVIFTDEWGGGTAPRCRATDSLEWGADALFDIVDGKMQFASYYKMPAPQTTQENCVAHNSSIIPVPYRDILVQAWYQGGTSVIDFTDTANPVEIAYFDRGPINVPNPTGLNLGGLWSTYWYNGYVYGTEIARGFDTFGLLASDQMSGNEIAAASEVRLEQFNAQLQSTLVNEPTFTVVRAAYDQRVRAGTLSGGRATAVASLIDRAEAQYDAGRPSVGSVLLRSASSVAGTQAGNDDLLDAISKLRANPPS